MLLITMFLLEPQSNKNDIFSKSRFRNIKEATNRKALHELEQNIDVFITPFFRILLQNFSH